MTPETHADIGAFLDGWLKTAGILIYAVLSWAAASEPDSLWMVLFIYVTGGLIGVAAHRRRKARGG